MFCGFPYLWKSVYILLNHFYWQGQEWNNSEGKRKENGTVLGKTDSTKCCQMLLLFKKLLSSEEPSRLLRSQQPLRQSQSFACQANNGKRLPALTDLFPHPFFPHPLSCSSFLWQPFYTQPHHLGLFHTNFFTITELCCKCLTVYD